MRGQHVTAEPGIVIRWPDQPDIDPIRKGMYVVRSTYIHKMWDGREYTVPVGFRTDDLSAPRPLWWWLPPDGVCRGDAVAHDRAYSTQGKVGEFTLTRADADKMLRKGLAKRGYDFVDCWLVWLAVRLFGGSHWNKTVKE